MFIKYHFDNSADHWVLTEKETGQVIAHFPIKGQILLYFMPEIVYHATEDCECPECEDTRDDVAIDERHSLTAVLTDEGTYRVSEYAEGGFGDSFR